MQYCFLQPQTLLSPPNTSIAMCHSLFGWTASFLLELLVTALCSSPVAYEGGSTHLLLLYIFAFSYSSWDSTGLQTTVGWHFLLQFCQNSSLWPTSLGWSCTTWFIASLSYASSLLHDKAVMIGERSAYLTSLWLSMTHPSIAAYMLLIKRIAESWG